MKKPFILMQLKNRQSILLTNKINIAILFYRISFLARRYIND